MGLLDLLAHLARRAAPVLLVLAGLLSQVPAAAAAVATDTPPGPSPAWTPAPSREGAWPLQPRPAVVHGFDPPATRWGAGHRGVDLLGWPGRPVHAALPGRVTFAGRLAGRGVVVVDHGALRTTYEPVSAGVAVGDVVGKGAVIGSLQGLGSHCGLRSCLHWGLLRGETYLDPLTLVGAGPIRLLPLSPVPPGAVPLAASLPRSPVVVVRSGSLVRAGSRAV